MSGTSDEESLCWAAADVLMPEDLGDEILPRLQALVGATDSIAYFFSADSQLKALAGSMAPVVPEYAAKFAASDPLIHALEARPRCPFVMTQQRDCSEIADDTTFRDSFVYQEHYRQLDIEHFLCVFPSDKPFAEPGMLGFLFGRNRKFDAFSERERVKLRLVEAPLRAAIRRAGRFQALKQQRNGLAFIIEQRCQGASAIFGDREQMIWANDAALSAIRADPRLLPALQGKARQLRDALRRPTEQGVPWTFECRFTSERVLLGEFQVVRDMWLQPVVVCHFRVRQIAEQPVWKLTAAEQRVLEYLANGLSNKDIAENLQVSVETIRTHVRHILEKLGVDCRAKAAVWAANNLAMTKLRVHS